MRIVATSDTHAVPTMPIPDGDVFVHAGDLMVRGYPSEWEERVEWLASLPHKTKLFVPGNHDFHMQVYPGPALQDMREAGVTVVGLPGNNHYASHRLPNGMSLLGLPYVTNLPRWAFNTTEDDLYKYLKSVWNAFTQHDVIVSHAPVLGILDTNNAGKNTGIDSYLRYLNLRPKVWISGHIHEAHGSVEKDGCRFYNVAMSDREYKHANPPTVIDL